MRSVCLVSVLYDLLLGLQIEVEKANLPHPEERQCFSRNGMPLDRQKVPHGEMSPTLPAWV